MANELDAEAAAWLVRLEADDATPDDIAQFEAWQSRSDRHYGAYIRARALWHSLGDRRQLVSEPVAPQTSQPILTTRSVAYPSRRMVLGTAMAACAASVVGGIMLSVQTRTVSADLGEIRRLSLGPGVSVVLNSGAALEYSERAPLAAVRLLRGEAIFEISKLGAEPFQLACQGASLTSFEGRFALLVMGKVLDVLVESGTLDLIARGGKAPSHRLSSNDEARIRPDGDIALGRADSAAIARRLAWEAGQIVLDGESVYEAAMMMNRYNRLQIAVGPGPIAGRRLVGSFSINDPRTFANSIARIYGGSTFETGGQILIRSK